MPTSRRELVVHERHQGIPAVALGGYVGGLLAGDLEGGEVTLRRPVPLGTPLWLERDDDGAGRLLGGDGETLAAIDPSVRLAIEVPRAVTLHEATEASARSLQRSTAYVHPFPGCMVCGSARPDGDGQRVFAGPVAGGELVAAPWRPHPAFAGPGGLVRAEYVWAVLDCPTIMALVFRAPADSTERVVSGRFAVARSGGVRAGAAHVVVGWDGGRQGRAYVTCGAVLSADGEVLAVARHTLVATGWGVPVGLERWRAAPDR